MVLFRHSKVKLLTTHSYIHVIHYLQEQSIFCILFFFLNNLYPQLIIFLSRCNLKEYVHADLHSMSLVYTNANNNVLMIARK